MGIQSEDGRGGRSYEVAGLPSGEGVGPKAWRRLLVYPIVRSSREVHLASLSSGSEMQSDYSILQLDVKNAF